MTAKSWLIICLLMAAGIGGVFMLKENGNPIMEYFAGSERTSFAGIEQNISSEPAKEKTTDTYTPSNSYTYSSDTQYINDSNVYMSAYPSHISDSGYVTFNLSTKSYSGNIDIMYGYNSENAKPKSAEMFNPHNETVQKSYTCNSPNWFNYTLTPKHFWCWQNYSNHIPSGNNKTIIGWNNGSSLIFDHDFNTTNIQAQTAYWNELQYSEYSDISGAFTKINYDYGGMDTWYYKTGIPITANQMYQMRVWQDVKFNTNGKYWFCAKPSSQTIAEANAAGTMYCLDPWWNSSYNFKAELNTTANRINQSYQFDMTSISGFSRGDIQSACNDIAIINASEDGTIPFQISNCSATNVSLLLLTPSNSAQIGYIYWNSTSTLARNISMRLFYDGFDTGNFPDRNNWYNASDCNMANFSVQNGVLNQTGAMGGTGTNCGWWWYGNKTATRYETVISKVKFITNNPNNYMSGVAVGVKNTSGNGNQARRFVRMYNNLNQIVFLDDDVAWKTASSFTLGNDNWFWFAEKSNSTSHAGAVWNYSTNKTQWSRWNNTISAFAGRFGWLGIAPATETGRSQFDEFQVWNVGYLPNFYVNENSGTIILGTKQTNGDTTPPTFSTNSTNGTVAGTQIKHSLLATDETALSGFIFSFDNGTGTFINNTWAAFGATGWANVSKGANATVGSTIRWFVWANDTSNNKNQSQIYSYLTTSASSCTCPSINTNWAIALGDYCKITSDCSIGAGNITFTGTGNVTFNASITAKGIGAIPNNQRGYKGNMARVKQG